MAVEGSQCHLATAEFQLVERGVYNLPVHFKRLRGRHSGNQVKQGGDGAAGGEHDLARPAAERAGLLRNAADALEAATPELISLCVREAGKTWPNAVAEVREAVDFCRYYAASAESHIALLACPAGKQCPATQSTGTASSRRRKG